MGVYRSDYILIGAKVDTKVCTDEFFESGENDDYLSRYKHKVGEIVYLHDGYSGEYLIVGIPIQFDKDGDRGLDLFDYAESEVDYISHADRVYRHIKEKFEIDVKPRLMVLSHFS